MTLNFLMYFGLKALLKEYGRNADIFTLKEKLNRELPNIKVLLIELTDYLLRMEKECSALEEFC